MNEAGNIRCNFENDHSLCQENSGTSYPWTISLYILATEVCFLHECCCSRQFVHIYPSLIYTHMKNDIVIVGVGEAVIVARMATP